MNSGINTPKIDLIIPTPFYGGCVEFVDNNSNHDSSGTAYRFTDNAHNGESGGSLEGKVNKIVPDLCLPTIGNIGNGFQATCEVKTSSGTIDYIYTVEQRDDKTVTLTGTVGDCIITVPLPRTLLTPNAYGVTADSSRAVYLMLFRCLAMPFRQAQHEEHAFNLLIKKLWA